MSLKTNIFFVLIYLPSIKCFSQNYIGSTFQQALNIYNNAIGINAHLFNGYPYADYDHNVKGSPFFKDSHFSIGSIDYDGIHYDNVKLYYDLLNDNVIAMGYDSSIQVILINEKIKAFSLLNHNFLKTAANEAPDFKNKFFDVLYKGNSEVLVRRKKIVSEQMVSTLESQRMFIEYNTYFVKAKNGYIKINSLSNLLSLFKDHKKEISKFIKSNKLKFNSSKENVVTQVAQYYDSLTIEK